jgi:hypothetical protein
MFLIPGNKTSDDVLRLVQVLVSDSLTMDGRDREQTLLVPVLVR